MLAEYKVFENTRNRSRGKGSTYCNIYVTEQLIAVVPLSKRWLTWLQIFTVVVASIYTLSLARPATDDAFQKTVIWWLIAIALVGLEYLLRYLKINKLRNANWNTIIEMDGFGAKKTDVTIKADGEWAIFSFGKHQLQINKTLAEQITKA